ncbi:MAG: sodium ion-translocating decarboxylase subunit beta [Victivallaceae bacterium]|nr:sodium ion-translocating decarboxylase subunit beta [Victivallaceae bacterium]
MHFIKITILALSLTLPGAILPAAEAQLKPAAVPADRKPETQVFTWIKTPDGRLRLVYTWNRPATIYSVSLEEGQKLLPGREVMVLAIGGRSKATVRITAAMQVLELNKKLTSANTIEPGEIIMTARPERLFQDSVAKSAENIQQLPGWKFMFNKLWHSTGIYDIIRQTSADPAHTWQLGIGRVLMMLVGLALIGLAIFKGFEPLLLLPIGFGAILANIPIAAIAGPDGLLGMVYAVGIQTGIFPLIIFMGVGAMTDFGPLIANPKTALLGAAAQFGIFSALIGALLLTKWVPGINFDLKDAASIGIIGGADGPTSIYLTSKLAPALLGPVAVAAYSYMALVPIIQPPIMKLCTTRAERQIKMKQLRHVSKLEKICFPLIITLLCALWLPDAAPLIGMLMLGNLMRESGVVDRLSDTAQNALINTVTIFLGLTVGSKLSADKFLNIETLGILVLGMAAFAIGTAAGVIFGKVMNKLSESPINPLIGAAGVSAVPMAARVANKIGLEADPHNFLLMHAMGPNVAGVIGSAVAAGALLCCLS